MQAGRMTYMLEMLEPVRITDKFGASAGVEYQQRGRIHAERVRINSQSIRESGESAYANYTVRYNIRWGHPVKEHWRVREMGGLLYNVVNIEPNRARGMKTLVCEKVNE